MKRREVKSKGEKERYNHLNAEFQRIARRGKKAFLSDQYKEIEGKHRMGKTRDLFKKIRSTKGIFHAKMGTIKDRNGMDLTEAEEFKEVARIHSSFQFSSVSQSCPTLCNPMNCSMPGLPDHLPEFTQTYVHRVSDAIQPYHPLSSPESTLPMRWPKYWSFTFSIIPSKEHSG